MDYSIFLQSVGNPHKVNEFQTIQRLQKNALMSSWEKFLQWTLKEKNEKRENEEQEAQRREEAIFARKMSLEDKMIGGGLGEEEEVLFTSMIPLKHAVAFTFSTPESGSEVTMLSSVHVSQNVVIISSPDKTVKPLVESKEIVEEELEIPLGLS